MNSDGKSLQIGIDARILDKGITGTGRCLYNLLEEIPKVDVSNKYFVFSGIDLDIDKNFFEHIISPSPSLIPFKIYSPLWLNKTLPYFLNKYKIDILFSPNVLIPNIKSSQVKYISVIHDIFTFTLKEYYPRSYRYYLSFLLPKTLKKTDKVITSSEYTKKEIVRIFNINPDKIEVIFSCIPNTFQKIKTNTSSSDFTDTIKSKKYLLYVGVIEKRKNLMGLIRIIDKLKEGGSKLDLFIVGRPGYGYSDIEKEIQKRSESIKCLNSVNDELLLNLYKNAFAFIFPSYFEGFGIPPLEAMQQGIPVLASNSSSLLEVVGDGGILHDPDDVAGFSNDIQRLENEPEFYNQMRYKAIKQATRFNINKETQKLVKIFNSLVG